MEINSQKSGAARKEFQCILLIDDDPITNFINKKTIQKTLLVNEIRIGNNGLEGLQILNELCQKKLSCPELIFLDINMPVMDGFEFYEGFKMMDIPDKTLVKIALLTTSAHSEDVDKALQAGINCYVRKPLTEEKIKEVIEKHF